MERKETLMQKQDQQATQNDQPKTTYEYFNEKWAKRDPMFKELEVPDYLIWPLTGMKFEDPVMLVSGITYDRLAIPQKLGADWVSNEQLAHIYPRLRDLHGFGEVKPCICSDPDDPDSDGEDPEPCRRCYRPKKDLPWDRANL